MFKKTIHCSRLTCLRTLAYSDYFTTNSRYSLEHQSVECPPWFTVTSVREKLTARFNHSIHINVVLLTEYDCSHIFTNNKINVNFGGISDSFEIPLYTFNDIYSSNRSFFCSNKALYPSYIISNRINVLELCLKIPLFKQLNTLRYLQICRKHKRFH